MEFDIGHDPQWSWANNPQTLPYLQEKIKAAEMAQQTNDVAKALMRGVPVKQIKGSTHDVSQTTVWTGEAISKLGEAVPDLVSFTQQTFEAHQRTHPVQPPQNTPKKRRMS